jgi:Bacterial extracellular solute-binding protein/von Willebrand factor type A domain
MAGLSAKAFASRNSCGSPVVVNVATSVDIAPAIRRIGSEFNRQNHQASGHCVQVKIVAEQSAAVAADVDGQAGSGASPAVDAWIPDSSTWVDLARGYPVGARQVQRTGIEVAMTPLMLVMPAAVAAQMPGFNNSLGWSFLLPSSIGGPSSSLHLRVDLPDPTDSAVGLATVVQMIRAIGDVHMRSHLTRFVFNSEATSEFDTPAELTSFVDQSRPPLFGRPVTVTTEQAVLSYDDTHPSRPLAARYPLGAGQASGTPELAYPYVLTSLNPLEQAAAKAFGQTLRSSYAAAVVRYYGFRSANGRADALPSKYGLPQQPLRIAPSVSAGEAQMVMDAWQRLSLAANDLIVADISGPMADRGGPGGETLEQVLSQSAELGLALFPGNTQMGLWEFASNLNAGKPYKQLVSLGPLTGKLGLISRRQQFEQLAAGLQPLSGGTSSLNDTVLAAYRQMVASYRPDDANAVVLMTAGMENSPGDMPLTTLLSRLRSLSNPSKPVEIVVVMLGTAGDFPAMQEIAAATDGKAFDITSPAEIGKVFFTAIAHRICMARCADP